MTADDGRVRMFCDRCCIPAPFTRLDRPRWWECTRCGHMRVTAGPVSGRPPRTSWMDMSVPTAERPAQIGGAA